MPFAAPAGALFATMLVFIEWIIVAALLFIWRKTFGAMLLYIADQLVFRVHVGAIYDHHFDLGHPFRVADDAMTTWLTAERDGLSIELGWTWHAFKETWEKTAEAVEWLTNETDATFDWLTRVHLPRWGRTLLPLLLPTALLAKLIQEAIKHLRPELHKTVQVIEHAVPQTITRVIRYSGGYALPNPWLFPKFRRAWHELTHWRHVTGLRLRRLEGLLAASGLALAVANMTGTRLKCWRPGGNIHRIMRGLCGADSGLIGDLLGLLADVWLIENVCTVLPLLETAASDIGEPLVKALTVVGAGLCKPGMEPAPLQGPAANIPTPVSGLVAAAA